MAIKIRKLAYWAIAALIVVACGSVVLKIYQQNMHIWLGDYFWNSPDFEAGDETVDIIFVVVDHWEPGGNLEPLNMWMTGYRELANKHVDADGRNPQHSWFYPIEQFRGYEVDSLVQLCREGYGDVEIHLHHGNDNSESLRQRFSAGIDSLNAHNALVPADGNTRFGFVHGNWALDNSRIGPDGRDMCGVNDEISILMDIGCYADFTFPALTQTAQPSLVNKIYYCQDDPQSSKSHNTGVVSQVGRQPETDEFMIFEGPMMIDWSDWRFRTHPNFEDGNLYWEIPTTIDRFENWLEANVHVVGRPNWVFVRPFTHGCSLRGIGAYDNILGANIDAMFTEMESSYNDGEKYRLHYMTTREAFNVVKAAEDGKDGNPNEYRDYVIQPYLYSVDESERGI